MDKKLIEQIKITIGKLTMISNSITEHKAILFDIGADRKQADNYLLAIQGLLGYYKDVVADMEEVKNEVDAE